MRRLLAFICAAWLVTVAVPRSASAQWLSIVNEVSAVSREGEVARGVVSFNQGELHHLDALHIVGWNGLRWSDVPAQVVPVGRSHLDGSINHALVLIKNTAPLTGAWQTAWYYAYVSPFGCFDPSACPLTVENPIKIRCYAGSFEVECGSAYDRLCVDGGGDASDALRVCFDPADFRLPNFAQVGSTPMISGDDASFILSARTETANTLLPGFSTHVDAGVAAPAPLANTAGYGLDNFNLPIDGGTALPGAVSGTETYCTRESCADLGGAVSLTVEESGPLRAVIRVSKSHPGPGRFGFIARIYVYHGESYFRVEYTLVNEEEARCTGNTVFTPYKHIERFAYSLRPASTTTRSPGGGATQTAMPQGPFAPGLAPLAGAIVPGRDPVTSGGWMMATDEAAADHPSVAVAHRYFEQTGPKRLGYNATEGIFSDLLFNPPSGTTADATRAHRQIAIAGGHARTYEFVVQLSRGASRHRTGEALRAIASRELLLAQDPLYASTHEAHFHSAPEQSFPALAAYHENGRRTERGEVTSNEADLGLAWFSGDRDFGANAWGGGVGGSFQQGQYGPAHAMFMRFRSSGKLEDLRRGEDMLRFAMDSSVVNWAVLPSGARPLGGANPAWVCHDSYLPGARQPRNGGAADGITSGWSPAYTYTATNSNMYLYVNDLVNYYFLTGNRRVVDLLAQIPSWPEFRLGDVVPGRAGFSREFFVPFVAYMDAWEAIGTNEVFRSDRIPPPAPILYKENEARDATRDLSLSDAITFFAGIQSMHDVAVRRSVTAVRNRSDPATNDYMFLDGWHVHGRVGDRYAPWVSTDPSAPAFPVAWEAGRDASGQLLCPSLLRSTLSGASLDCFPTQVPSLGSGILTPWHMPHAAEALFRYHVATGCMDSVYQIRDLVALQHSFRSPFGAFQGSPLHRDERLQPIHDHVASSAAYLFLLETRVNPGPPWAFQTAYGRLIEASPSVDFRLSFRRRPIYGLVALDADLYPFLHAWQSSVFAPGDLPLVAALAIDTSMQQYVLDHPSIGAVRTDFTRATPGSNPRQIFWDIFDRVPLLKPPAAPNPALWYSPVTPFDPALSTAGAPEVYAGINALFGESLYARVRLAKPESLGEVYQGIRDQMNSHCNPWGTTYPPVPCESDLDARGLPSTSDPPRVRASVYRYAECNLPYGACQLPR